MVSPGSSETIDDIYGALREYGYTITEILGMNEDVVGLAGLLEALREHAAKPGSAEWLQFKVDEKLRTHGTHKTDGRRIHFCKHCGKAIVFGSADETV
jgi:hypothetical protein